MMRFRYVTLRTWPFVLCGAVVLPSVTAIAISPWSQGDATLHVTVTSKATGVDVIPNVYIGLIPRDQPLRRPKRETIATSGTADLLVPPGRYMLRASADGFETDFRQSVVVNQKFSQINISLIPEFKVTGLVTDQDGHPIANARIAHPIAVAASSVGGLSKMAMDAVGSRLHVTSDANGSWQLAVSTIRKSPLMVEAPGYEPAWVVYDPTGPHRNQITITLRKGSALKAMLDRIDPNIVVSVVSKTQEAPSVSTATQSVPPFMEMHVWARETTRKTVSWDSLPAGQYRIVARYSDPLRFAPPVDVGTVTLTAGETAHAHVRLPPTPAPAPETTYARFFVPQATSLAGLHAFGRIKGGRAKEERYSVEETIGGKVVYVAGVTLPEDAYLTTNTHLILASPRPQAANRRAITSAETVHLPRGDGKLRITVPEGVVLPATAVETLHGCSPGENMTLPVSVGAKGDITIPLAVACRVVTLLFEGFTPLTLITSVREGEQKWLGDHTLLAPSSAEIHVVHQPSGTNAAHASVEALVRSGTDVHPIMVAQATADDQGHLIMKNLPASENVTFQARDAITQLVGSTTVRVEPAKRVLVGPLEIPELATLTVSPKLDPDFKAQFPEASILSVSAEREDAHPAELHTLTFDKDKAESVFQGIAPGRWHIATVLDMGGGAGPQPLDIDVTTIASGANQHIWPPVKPLITTGQVLFHGQGVRAQVLVSDPPGPTAVLHSFPTAVDGTFKAVLPQIGIYAVRVMRMAKGGAPEVDLGPMMFDGSTLNLVLPEGTIGVKVTRAGQPLANVRVAAVMQADSPDGSGVSEMNARSKTDGNGATTLDSLAQGVWAVKALAPDGGVAEKDVTIAGSARVEITLDIDVNNVFEGNVFDANSLPAASASVDCVFSTGQTPQSASGDADADGHFIIHLPTPPPQSLQCGVTTVDGAIAAFPTSVTRTAQLEMSQSAGALTIDDWGQKTIPDRFWLVDDSGHLFNLSWVARKIGRYGSPLTILRLPAGRWTVVEVRSSVQFLALVSGAARSLPPVANIIIQQGQSETISVQHTTGTIP